MPPKHSALFLITLISIACQYQAPPTATTLPSTRPIALAALDSDAVIKYAATTQPALQQCLLRFNQTQAHKDFRAQFEKTGPTKRLIVIRYLSLRGGFGDGRFETTPQRITAAEEDDWLWNAIFVLYENDEGWGYLTNVSNAIANSPFFGSFRIVPGHLAAFMRHPKNQALLEKLFNESLKPLNQNPKAPNVILNAPGTSWDGIDVFVMTAVTPSASGSIAEINADVDNGPIASSAMNALSLLYQISHALEEYEYESPKE